MELDGEQREQLFKALLSAFPKHSELARMVRFKLSKNLHEITGQGDLEEAVFDLIEWAEANGQLEELITKAHVFRPGNPELKEFVEKYIRPHSDIQDIRKKIKILAREYEQVRQTMPPGDERTRRMEVLVTEMRVQALAGRPLLQELANSFSPGERLAAIIILQVQADANYLLWLAERLCVEKPFAGYHASVALLVAAQLLGSDYRARVQKAIEMAQDLLKPGSETRDRARMLKEAERVIFQGKEVNEDDGGPEGLRR